MSFQSCFQSLCFDLFQPSKDKWESISHSACTMKTRRKFVKYDIWHSMNKSDMVFVTHFIFKMAFCFTCCFTMRPRHPNVCVHVNSYSGGLILILPMGFVTITNIQFTTHQNRLNWKQSLVIREYLIRTNDHRSIIIKRALFPTGSTTS